jgi:hypothetical protein
MLETIVVLTYVYSDYLPGGCRPQAKFSITLYNANSLKIPLKGKWQYIFLFSHLKELLKQNVNKN